MRIAPNNSLPATHFIEVWRTPVFYVYIYVYEKRKPITFFKRCLDATVASRGKTIAIFKIRENKLPTLHNFKQTKT